MKSFFCCVLCACRFPEIEKKGHWQKIRKAKEKYTQYFWIGNKFSSSVLIWTGHFVLAFFRFIQLLPTTWSSIYPCEASPWRIYCFLLFHLIFHLDRTHIICFFPSSHLSLSLFRFKINFGLLQRLLFL